MDYELIAKALFESYENIYDIDLNTNAYKSFYESEAYKSLELNKEGDDFFKASDEKVRKVVAPDDRDFVLKKLQKDNLIKALDKHKYYTFIYRIIRDGKEVYHQIRAAYQPTDEGMHVYMGIRDIDAEIRLEQAHRKERKVLREELQMSKIHNFTNQMQPHFLYNTLGSIQEIMLENPQKASSLLGDFTLHLRSCIKSMVKDEPVPFSEELRNIKAYVNIERMRFGDKLHVHYDISSTEFSVLPLTIQPIVENAIRHGIYKRGARGGDVYIRAFANEEHWIVQVQDTGVGFNVDKFFKNPDTKNSVGLKNIEFRLNKVMGGTMQIVSNEGTGTIVTVLIPKESTA